MTVWEQKGYDAWIEMWVAHNCSPTATNCPAKWMREGPERSELISGWNRAKREHQSPSALAHPTNQG